MIRLKRRNRAARTRSPWDRDVYCVRVRLLKIFGPAIGIIFFGVMLAFLTIVWNSERHDPEGARPLLVTILIVAAPFVALVSVLVMRLYWQDRLRRLLTRSAGHPLSRVQRRQVVEALVNLHRLERLISILRVRAWSRDRIIDASQRYRLPESFVIVGSKVRPYLRAIPRTGELLEPEPVGARVETRELWKLLALLAATALLWFAVTGGLQRWLILPLLIIGLITLSHLAVFIFRLLFGSLRQTSGLVVGPGAMASQRKLWMRSGTITVVLLVGKLLRVDIVSAEGIVTLEFPVRGAGFQEFWQRWMHPHPRPDIVRDAAR